MSIRDKEVRKACWDSRDRYWACLDKDTPQSREECLVLRRSYENCCPSQWVKHFDRKRQYFELKERIYSISLSDTKPSCPALSESLPKRHHRAYRGILSS